MATQDSLFPAHSWTEDASLETSSGRRLSRYGSVQQATKILDDCDRHVIYELKEAGLIRAYKRRVDRPNSHLRVDLLSVWEYKQRQMEPSFR